MPAHSTCRYVRLNALNVPHVLRPRFIAPFKELVSTSVKDSLRFINFKLLLNQNEM